MRKGRLLLVAAVPLALAVWLWIRSHGEPTPEDPQGAAVPTAPVVPEPPSAALEGRAAPSRAADGPREASPIAVAANVRVTVLDESDRPIVGAHLTLRPEVGVPSVSDAPQALGPTPALGPIETEADGRAAFPAVPVGKFWVQADASGFEQNSRSGTARANEETAVKVVMRALVPVTGHVRLRSGAGVSARVSIVRGGSIGGRTETCSGELCRVAETTSALDGSFRVGVPRNTILTAVATAPGFSPAESVLERGREGPEVLLILEPGGTLRGIVRSPDGKACAGAKVFVVPSDEPAFLENPSYVIGADGSMSWGSEGIEREAEIMGGSGGAPSSGSAATRKAIRATSGADGSYEVAGLKMPAAYRVLAQGCGGARGASGEEALSPDSPAISADVPLTPRSILIVHLESPEGVAVTSKTRVSLVGAREHFLDPRGGRIDLVEGEAGRFKGIAPGSYAVEAQMPGSVPVTRAVEVVEGKATEIVIRGQKGLTLAGFVVDPAKRVIPNAHVRFVVTSGAGVADQEASATSDGEGRFRIEGLQDASGALSADCEGFAASEPGAARPGADPATIVLRRGAEIRGRLVVPAGTSLPKSIWIAHLHEHFNRGMQSSKVAADGTFREVVVALDIPMTLVLMPRVGAWVVLGTFAFRSEEVRDFGGIPIDEGRTVTGRVTDAKGVPLAGITVWADVRGAPALGDGMMVERHQDTTDSDGRFAIRRLANSAVVLRTAHAPFAPAAVLSDGPGEASITLVAAAYLSGRLLDANGLPSPSRIFRLEGGDEDSYRKPMWTGPQGTFEFGPLAPGAYVGMLDAGSLPAVDREVGRVTLMAGERKTVEWRAP